MRLAFLLTIVILTGFMSSESLSQDKPEFRQFTQELTNSLRELEAYYGNVSGKVVWQEYRQELDAPTRAKLAEYFEAKTLEKTTKKKTSLEFPKYDPSKFETNGLTEKSEVLFRINDPLSYVIVRTNIKKKYQSVKTADQWDEVKSEDRNFESVTCNGTGYSFGYIKKEEDSEPVVQRIDQTKDRKPLMLRYVLNPLLSPISIYSVKLSKLISRKDFTIKQLTKEKHNGIDSIRMDFKLDAAPQDQEWSWLDNGYIIFADTKHHEILESESRRNVGSMTVRTIVEYEDHPIDIPTPKKVVIKTAPGYKFVAMFSDIQKVESDPTKFTLAAFGIPEVGNSTKRSSTGTILWVGAIALVFLVLAVVTRRISRRI